MISFIRKLFTAPEMPRWMAEADEEIKRNRQRARLQLEVKAPYNRAAGDRHGDRKQVKHVFMVRRTS